VFPLKTKIEFKTGWYLQFKRDLAVRASLLLCLAAATGPAQTYTVLHSFPSGANDRRPWGELVLSGTTLYGTACHAPGGWGAVFKLNTDGSDYMVLKSFASGIDGFHPRGGLVLSGTTLYGTAYSGGGDTGRGIVFKVGTDGSEFSILKQFTGPDGDMPMGGVVLSDGVLYGTTQIGGNYNQGTVFKVNTDGTGFGVLKHFAGTDGAYSRAGLILSGGTLYGTTADGGSFNCGTVFRINTNGDGFSVLKQFTGSDGATPEAGLALSGETLYGTTYSGGSSNYGAVFRINTDGGEFSVLKRFTGSDGGSPAAGLVLSSGALFGTTAYSGSNSYGTVFMIKPDGTDYRVLKYFSGADGNQPRAGLTISGGTYYGTAGMGGISNGGVVFSLSITPPTIIASPQSQTAELGHPVTFVARITRSPLLSYQWFFNDLTIVGGTNRDLLLPRVQVSDVGAYSLNVRNPSDSVTSAPAMLNVIPAVERRPVPGVRLTGETGSSLNVDYASSISSAPDWQAFDTVNLTNPPQYSFDLTVPLPPQRFYRAWQTGVPGVRPSLDLMFVPAIALSGNVGDSLRVDCINQFGPTDAWMTLNTVTLTNTSQLYFDVSAPGQPPRLYRIVPNP
jgi:uncharacterized repeat protein (TIGR03803 family)